MEELAGEQFALLQDGLPLLLLSWRSIVPALWDFLRENSQALNHLAVAAIGTIGLPLLWIRTRAADRQARAANEQARIANVQAKTAEQGHITDRFTKAIEQLGSEKLAVRLGAIYALERLAKDSPEDHWTIMEVLTAHLRKEAIAPLVRAAESGVAGKDIIAQVGADLPTQIVLAALLGKEGPLKLRPASDIQAILTILGRRSEEAREREVAEGRCLDLSATDLCGSFLNHAHLERASLIAADLRFASLNGSKLAGSFLFQADLRGAQGLKQEQLNAAYGNKYTKLPEDPDLKHPPHWLEPEVPCFNHVPTSPPPPPEPRTDNVA